MQPSETVSVARDNSAALDELRSRRARLRLPPRRRSRRDEEEDVVSTVAQHQRRRRTASSRRKPGALTSASCFPNVVGPWAIVLLLAAASSWCPTNSAPVVADAFALDASRKETLLRGEMVGLWRLTTTTTSSASTLTSFPRLPDTGRREEGPTAEARRSEQSSWASAVGVTSDFGDGVLLMLKEDGSFVQYGSVVAPTDADGPTTRAGAERGHETKTRAVEREVPSSISEAGEVGHEDDENDDEGSRTLRGAWDYVDGERLVLALARPAGADARRVHDTTLSGEVAVSRETEALSDDAAPLLALEEEAETAEKLPRDDGGKQLGPARRDVFLSVPRGEICAGKFMYPPKHRCFFERPGPIHRPVPIGNFELRQVMGALNAFNTEEKEAADGPRFRDADFYGRKFLLTSEPIQMKRPKRKLVWNKREGKYVEDGAGRGRPAANDDLDRPIDLRVTPIEFFRNNTFCATGADKILRGRFWVEGQCKDKLWFAVSLFGSGRSAPGSVYSEGPGLSHEDRRSYVGDIELLSADWTGSGGDSVGDSSADSSTAIFVEGAIMVGLDMGTDTRATPVAKFTMREVESSVRGRSKDDDAKKRSDESESIFE